MGISSKGKLLVMSVSQSLWQQSPSGHAAYPSMCPTTTVWPSSMVPVVENSVDHHPLRFYPIAIEAFLHLCKLRVLVLSLSALLFVTTEIPRRWLIHIVLALIVSEHHLTVQLQLQAESGHQGAAVNSYPRDCCLDPFGCTLHISGLSRFTCSSDTQEQCQ